MSALANFFDSSTLLAHGTCLFWRPDLLWLHVFSDLAIGAAYYSIPVALLLFLARRQSVEFTGLIGLFAAFIIACGTTHFFSVWNLWHADYAAEGLAKALTAAISVVTAILIWPMLRHALVLPSPSALEQINDDLSIQIRERSAAAESLRQSEDRYRTLYNRSPAPMHSLDAGGRLIGVSDYWLTMLGYERDEVIGRHLSEFMVPRSAVRFQESHWDEFLAVGEVRDEPYEFIRHDGQIVDVLLSSRLERDQTGAFRQSFALLVDVTDRNRAEAALKREREFSELLVRSSPQGVFAFDRDLKLTLWNSALERMTGVNADEILGRRPELFGDGYGASGVLDAMESAINGRSVTIADEPFVFSTAGRRGFFEATVAPVYGEAGIILGGVAFLHETTEQRGLEEALRQAQKMEAVGQLTGGIAHDFNNVLTIVAGNLELLEMRLTDRPDVKRLAAAASMAVSRAERLTQQLLAFSRKQQLQPEPLDLNAVISGIRDLLRKTVGERIEIDFRPGEALWQSLVDRNQVESMLLNLILNARDALPDGGRITIETENAQPRSSMVLGLPPGLDSSVLLTVTDTGTGMPQDVLDRVFEPFFTTKPQGRGTGLGLSMIYGFVRQSGGHIVIESTEGTGTRVLIYLPRALGKMVPDAAQPHREVSLGRGETVLVVEDDEAVRQYACGVLDDLGYRVIEAETGDAGLVATETNPEIDIVLTDIVMPGLLDGVMMAREIQKRRPNLKILFTSGYSDTQPQEGGLVSSANFLKKPYRPADLAEKLRALLLASAT
ncbi:MAG TPA: PAS domain S-box protein [Aliidongia sp.]|uniref:hybrid sensor histidine kinase/response regulator n=1 Tax=Aliidongia sp. TaxID=1914230 RepID=UPI002DDD92FD|nr:PAS domain S-box protein [Aliidongia sp.]HEV2675888.1 PAS domain S-box protein [Aliidongia sp.]